MQLSNRWNRFIYRVWSPIYDWLAGRIFCAARKRSIELLDCEPGERVLLVGVGTGLDLPFLPPAIEAVGIDLSPAMLKRARAMLPLRARTVTLLIGDAQALPFADDSFDASILALILSVVPDGGQCLREAMRVTRPGGRTVVFDKFLPAGQRASVSRRLLHALTSFFGTDINRRFDDMTAGIDCKIELDEPGLFHGAYRTILITKPGLDRPA